MTQQNKWTPAAMPNLSGKTAVVTGANSGLGYETSLALAQKGARVVMACRNLTKGQQAAEQIRQIAPEAELVLRSLDLADLASVRAFSKAVQAEYTELDLLINNAGVMALPYRQTADGFEMQFGTNHLGHFALTGLLLERLLAAPAGRVVTVSSMLHRSGQMNFDDLQGQQTYNKRAAYGQSKLANLLFAYELQRRLTAVSANLISVAAHPGYAATNLQDAGPAMENSAVQRQVMRLANKVMAQSQAMGALPLLYAATAVDVNGGDFIGPDGFGGMRGYPAHVQSSERSHDLATAVRLWDVSVALTDVHYVALDKVLLQQFSI
ncbi:MAG: SDR family oxidoreductase [Chloroflexi bacterium]|nr:SDR family oxidoreductase [Chloroflexota bacterium]MBP7593347.1 SDR family oxidoreductase [Chloroflexota bacterium]